MCVCVCGVSGCVLGGAVHYLNNTLGVGCLIILPWGRHNACVATWGGARGGPLPRGGESPAAPQCAWCGSVGEAWSCAVRLAYARALRSLSVWWVRGGGEVFTFNFIFYFFMRGHSHQQHSMHHLQFSQLNHHYSR